MEEQSESTRCWCHQCGRLVHPVMGMESIKCLLCQFGFVEIMDSVRSDHHHRQNEVASNGDSRYLTQLRILGKKESQDGFHRSDSPQSKTIDQRELVDKIKAALKHLNFREERVLVQFWSTHVVGKHQLLATIYQPFGLGVIDEGLCSYRRDSERYSFVVKKDNEESPPARVFRRGLPEWTSDITNYLSTDFPQQEYAIHCNLHGYLALPVFNSTTGLCVGVLELLMPSKHMSYTYEVQQVHNAMKTVDLITPQALDRPYLNVRCNLHGYLVLPVFNSNTRLSVGVLELSMTSHYPNFAYEVQHIHEALKTENLISTQVYDCPASNVCTERMQKELHTIWVILKDACAIHNLTLAQTWAVEPPSSFVPQEDVLQKSCSSFDTRCFGKVCISTSGLPFHLEDLGMWSFREASVKLHLEKSRGVVGRALSSRGSCFCGDVTKLSEKEYPLVHNAHMSGLNSCLAIFLRSIENDEDYVLEFFLPCMKDGRSVINLVQTLKQNIEVVSGFELGDTSFVQEIGPHMDANMEPDTISTSSNWMADNSMFLMDSSDSESMVSMVKTCDTFTDVGMVEVKVTFNQFAKTLQFSNPLIMLDLKNEVAKRFNLEGKELKLKYRDEENDLILICNDDDLKLVLDTSVINNSINLICESD